MDSIIPNFIQLFGSISGIITAFLVLLYQAVIGRTQYAKQRLLFEVASSLKCSRVKSTTKLDEGNELYDELVDEITHEQINTKNIDELLKLLTSRIGDLRNKSIEKATAEEAGKRAKKASHIETAHKNDIEEALSRYNTANKFYEDFPKLTSLTIGVPLALSAIFILIKYFQNWIITNIGKPYLELILLFLSIGGLIFVFYIIVTTLLKLKKIDG